MLKSKTMRFAALLAVLSIAETQTQLFANYIGPDALGILTLVISMIVAVLRIVTTGPVGGQRGR